MAVVRLSSSTSEVVSHYADEAEVFFDQPYTYKSSYKRSISTNLGYRIGEAKEFVKLREKDRIPNDLGSFHHAYHLLSAIAEKCAELIGSYREEESPSGALLPTQALEELIRATRASSSLAAIRYWPHDAGDKREREDMHSIDDGVFFGTPEHVDLGFLSLIGTSKVPGLEVLLPSESSNPPSFVPVELHTKGRQDIFIVLGSLAEYMLSASTARAANHRVLVPPGVTRHNWVFFMEVAGRGG